MTATELLQKEADNIQYYKEGAFYVAEYKEGDIIKESFYNSITIRNSRTFEKIADILKK